MPTTAISRIVTLMAVILLVMASAPAGAAIEGFAGWTLPLGDLDDVSDAGVHGGAALTTPLLPGLLDAGPALIYHDLDGVAPGDDVTLLEMLVQARLAIPAGPSLLVAAGLVSPSVTVNGRDRQWGDRFELVIGAGTRFLLLDLSAAWHHNDLFSALSVSAGLRF